MLLDHVDCQRYIVSVALHVVGAKLPLCKVAVQHLLIPKGTTCSAIMSIPQGGNKAYSTPLQDIWSCWLWAD